MTWRTWLHGLAAAFIGAFATAASGAITLPGVFNLTHDGLINFAKVTIPAGLISVFAYLKQSPLWSSTSTVVSIPQAAQVTVTPVNDAKQ